jgi:threonine dehydratase
MTEAKIDVPSLVLAAEKRIRPYIRETILEPAPFYGAEMGAQVFFKCENLQHTGSFKVRGALSKILGLSREQRRQGVVTASTGNHGAAVAYSLKQVGASGIVFVPEIASPSKVQAIRRLGAQVRYFGSDSAETEVYARQYAQEFRGAYVPPYNDPQVMGGQGTIGLELSRQLDSVDAVFVSVGGGGLIAGIAGYLKSIFPRVRVFGCSPQNSQVMAESVQAGRILDLPSLPTLSDGTAGGIEAGSITFPLCHDLVDEWILVSECEIQENLRQFIATQHMLVEGSAAVAIAGFKKAAESRKMRDWLPGKNVVIVLCGANIGLAQLKQVLSSDEDQAHISPTVNPFGNGSVGSTT